MTLAKRPLRVIASGSKGRVDASSPRESAGGQPQEDTDHNAIQAELAVERTILAAERTYDAWIRTGLAALASGLGARALLAGSIPAWLTKTTGAMLVLFAAFCFLVGAWREISTGARLPTSHIHQLPSAMLIIVNGFLMAVALATFVGVVLTR